MIKLTVEAIPMKVNSIDVFTWWAYHGGALTPLRGSHGPHPQKALERAEEVIYLEGEQAAAGHVESARKALSLH